MFQNKLIAFALLIFLFSCKKIDPNKTNFGDCKFEVFSIKDSVVSLSSNQLKIYTEFVVLDTGYILPNLKQGASAFTNFNYSTESIQIYNFALSNSHTKETDQKDSNSTLILFDKSKVNNYCDECLGYFFKNINETNEFALGGYSDQFGNGQLKIFGDGFYSKNNPQIHENLFNTLNQENKGIANPYTALLNAIEYLDANATNSNKNIILFSTAATINNQTIVNTIIQKANEKNIKIHIICTHNYDFTKISRKTNGVHFYNDYNPRLILYSIDKIISNNYIITSFDITITRSSGTFQTGYSFGYFFNIKDASNTNLKRIYFDVNY
jgi:hypothetical protein